MTGAGNDSEALKRIAVNLFYGWGYDPYKRENQLRADDLAVRAKMGWLLGQAREAVERAESAWRREHLPEPTREKPRPDTQALDGARKLEALGREIGGLASQISAAPVPEADRMTDRYRREGDTLQQLLQCDLTIVGRAETLRVKVADADGAALLAAEAELRAGLAGLVRALRERQAILQV